MATIIKIDIRSKAAQAFLEFVKTLPFAEIENSKRYNAETEKVLKEVKEGKTIKAKNSKELFKELGI